MLCERQTSVLRVHRASVKRIGVEIHREYYVDFILTTATVMKTDIYILYIRGIFLTKHKHSIEARYLKSVTKSFCCIQKNTHF